MVTAYYPYQMPPRIYRLGRFTTSETEIKQIAKSWVAISLAFAIVFAGGLVFPDVILMFIASAFTVGLGFIFHELSHKITAQKYGCFAEYRGNDRMLMFAVIMAFAGFVFAAPGAVMIAGPVDWRRNGIISAAGPTANLLMAAMFYGLSLLFGGFLGFAFSLGYRINGWLALFNLIPVLNLDGKKILHWNRGVYFALVLIGVLFSFILG